MPKKLTQAVVETQQPSRGPSKLAELERLLRRPEGATVADLAAATGWQPHSVRGALSGSLKKARGLTVVSEKSDAGRVYRIVDEPRP